MAKSLLLFVHGLGGGSSTWGKFPELINSDPDLREAWHAQEFSFPTRIWSLPFLSTAPRLQILADGLRDTIKHRYEGAERIVMSCHSLGGLVGRRYLLDQYKVGKASPVKGLFLFATPNDGAGLARFAKFLWPWNVQLRQLCYNADVVDDLNRDWQQAAIDHSVTVTCFLGSNDKVVSEKSARGHWHPEQVKIVLGANHRSLVKPANKDALQYKMVRDVLRSFRFHSKECVAASTVSQGPATLPVARIEDLHRKGSDLLILWSAASSTVPAQADFRAWLTAARHVTASIPDAGWQSYRTELMRAIGSDLDDGDLYRKCQVVYALMGSLWEAARHPATDQEIDR